MSKIEDKLQNRREIFESAFIEKGYRNGIEIEKGVILNEKYMREHFDEIGNMLTIFSAYPDILLDLMTPHDSNFRLFFYQRITLRAIMRYRDVYITAPRAFSKSFITILGLMLQCIFMPGTKRFICAPGKGQSAQIAKEKIFEIYDRWPFFKKEIIGGDVLNTPGNFGKDYVTLIFRNGSRFDVVAPLDSTRGGRRQGGLIDEVRDHEEEPLNDIVLPLLNVSRRLPDNTVNFKEPNQQRIFMTSAGVKTSFAYGLLLDVFEDSIIHPKSAICMGCDFRVPMKHDLIDKTYINKLKTSPSYSAQSFAREYLSIWEGASEESWFKFDRLLKYRKIKNPETHAKYRESDSLFYLISVDVGRIHDQTVACVFRVNIDGSNRYTITLVNIQVLAREAKTKTFEQQAIDIKKLIEAFHPREVVIDTNGLGVGLGDEMIKGHYDKSGKYYPPYGFKNDENYLVSQPKEACKILYGIKANGPLKSKIQSNVYAKLTSGSVRFLIREQEAKSALMATKVGQKMSLYQKTVRLLPHEMTSRLFDEMANLRLKKTASADIVLEQINTRYPDDKYFSFAYGLWPIKELEDESAMRKRRRFGTGASARKLTFFN